MDVFYFWSADQIPNTSPLLDIIKDIKTGPVGLALTAALKTRNISELIYVQQRYHLVRCLLVWVCGFAHCPSGLVSPEPVLLEQNSVVHTLPVSLWVIYWSLALHLLPPWRYYLAQRFSGMVGA